VRAGVRVLSAHFEVRGKIFGCALAMCTKLRAVRASRFVFFLLVSRGKLLFAKSDTILAGERSSWQKRSSIALSDTAALKKPLESVGNLIRIQIKVGG
jgi:hypothetical protein